MLLFKVRSLTDPPTVSIRSEPFPLLILIPLPILSLSSLKAVIEVFNPGCGLYLFTLSREGQPARKSPGPQRSLAKKSSAWRRSPPARKPRHEFRKLLLRHRRRQPFQTNAPRRRRQAPWHIAASPMTVSLPVFLPNEQQTLVMKFMENL